MKQLLQDARTGVLKVAEVPSPQLLPGCVLVRVAASLVSAGTERASSEFASKSLTRLSFLLRFDQRLKALTFDEHQ